MLRLPFLSSGRQRRRVLRPSASREQRPQETPASPPQPPRRRCLNEAAHKLDR
jgi:hypothetical protein